MRRTQRIILLALSAVLIVSIAAPAFAASTDAEAESTTETTLVAQTDAGELPAVVFPPAVAEEEDQPWTARFLIPLFVVSALFLVLGVGVQYDRTVRTRYKVVS